MGQSAMPHWHSHRHCPACGQPKSYVGAGYCGPCVKAYRLSHARPCAAGCGSPAVAYGAYCNRCRYPARKRAWNRPGRTCPQCKGPIRKGYCADICRDCASMYAAERRAKRRGS